MKENTMAARPAKQLSAREKRRYEDLKRAREEQYKHALSRLSPLLLSVFLLSILLLALFFCDLSYIHNTDVGREVSVSVWSYALATVSGSFSSPAAVFGDIAVPFYYYAETGTVLTGILSLVLVIAALALAVLSAVVFLRRKYDLLPLLLFAAVGHGVLLLRRLVSSLPPTTSQHLPRYFMGHAPLLPPSLLPGGPPGLLPAAAPIPPPPPNSSQSLRVSGSRNPACSIRSDAYFPLIAALAVLSVAIVAAVKYHSAHDILSGKRPMRTGGAA